MTFQEKRELLAEINPDALLADGYEDALIGTATQFNTTVALYDRDICIRILMERDGMSQEEAEDFFTFNVIGAWVGPMTPIFVTFFERG
jgi:hypothetical protein